MSTAKMRVVLPVKSFKNAKLRLQKILSNQQRAQFSLLMLEDVLQTLSTSTAVEGVTMVSSDKSVEALAERYQAQCLHTAEDRGYSEDALLAVSALQALHKGVIAIFPGDVPLLSHKDLSRLRQAHEGGLTLCPAVADGGTNAVLFTPPLTLPLMFGLNSLQKYQQQAQACNVPVRIEQIEGLERDIDRPDDLHWLKKCSAGGKAWSYLQELDLSL